MDIAQNAKRCNEVTTSFYLNFVNLRDAIGAPELVMVATSAVEREFREINRRTEVGTKWTDGGVERVTRLLLVTSFFPPSHPRIVFGGYAPNPTFYLGIKHW